jgi:hypothetical protein
MKYSVQPFGLLKDFLASGRLACTSNNFQILRNITNLGYNSKFVKSILNVFSIKKAWKTKKIIHDLYLIWCAKVKAKCL